MSNSNNDGPDGGAGETGSEPAEFVTGTDPFAIFDEWYADAVKSEPNDPNAMAIATVDEDGLADVRMVLLKGVDDPAHQPRGFVFYTNLESAKGRQLAVSPKAAFVMHWKSLERQIRVRGPVQPVSTEEVDDYFNSRARLSRIGAWASEQSRPLEGRLALEKRVAKYTAEFGIGAIPRPPHWSGFRIIPNQIEFWRSRPFRLHDRVVYTRSDMNGPWHKQRLYP